MIKREDLLAKGYTAEQVTELLDIFHNDQNATVEELKNSKKFPKTRKKGLAVVEIFKNMCYTYNWYKRFCD